MTGYLDSSTRCAKGLRISSNASLGATQSASTEEGIELKSMVVPAFQFGIIDVLFFLYPEHLRSIDVNEVFPGRLGTSVLQFTCGCVLSATNQWFSSITVG